MNGQFNNGTPTDSGGCCKLFLGGIANESTAESIVAHFSAFGTVVDSVVMVKDGRPRGFGFVTFDNSDSAAMVLTQDQVLDGKVVDCKPADGSSKGPGKGGGIRHDTQPNPYQVSMANRPGSGGSFLGGASGSYPIAAGKGSGGKGGKDSMVTDKVFIGGLPQDCVDQKIIDYFMQYGNIVDAVVMKDKTTGRSRGFGFVQFDNTDSADRVMEDYQSHQIDEKWIECKKAVPQATMESGGQKGPSGWGGVGKGMGGGMGPYGGGGGWQVPQGGPFIGKGAFGKPGYNAGPYGMAAQPQYGGASSFHNFAQFGGKVGKSKGGGAWSPY